MDIPNSSQPLRPLEKKMFKRFYLSFFPSYELSWISFHVNYVKLFFIRKLEITEFLLGKQMRFSIFHKL